MWLSTLLLRLRWCGDVTVVVEVVVVVTWAGDMGGHTAMSVPFPKARMALPADAHARTQVRDLLWSQSSRQELACQFAYSNLGPNASIVQTQAKA